MAIPVVIPQPDDNDQCRDGYVPGWNVKHRISLPTITVNLVADETAIGSPVIRSRSVRIAVQGRSNPSAIGAGCGSCSSGNAAGGSTHNTHDFVCGAAKSKSKKKD